MLNKIEYDPFLPGGYVLLEDLQEAAGGGREGRLERPGFVVDLTG